jgi:hypothetical protein
MLEARAFMQRLIKETKQEREKDSQQDDPKTSQSIVDFNYSFYANLSPKKKM